MLTCIACSKQLNNGSLHQQEGEDSIATPRTKQTIKALTAQVNIFDYVFLFLFSARKWNLLLHNFEGNFLFYHQFLSISRESKWRWSSIFRVGGKKPDNELL